jgi:hypothetical protein
MIDGENPLRYYRILQRHDQDCGCWDCIHAMAGWIVETAAEIRERELRMSEFSLEQQIKSVEREIALRENLYPRQVANGKMRQEESDFHISEMRAVLKTLKWLLVNRGTVTKAVKEANANGVHGPAKADGDSEGVGDTSPDVPPDGGEGPDNAGRG